MLGLLALEAFLGARLDLRARLGQLRQPLLAPRQLVGNRHAVRQVGLIRSLGLGHQLGHLGLQLRLDPAGMLIGQRAVAAGVGVDLRAIQRHRAQRSRPISRASSSTSHEQPLDLPQKAPPERSDRVVVGMIVRRDEAERHRIIRRPLQLAARKHAGRIAIDHNAQQQRRVIRRRTRAAVAARHRRQVQPRDHLDHEPRQVILRKPLVHPRRQQKNPCRGQSDGSCSSAQRSRIKIQCCNLSQVIPVSLSPTGC